MPKPKAAQEGAAIATKEARAPRDRAPPKKLLHKITSACEVLDCGRSSIYALIKAGKLRTVKIGNDSRITDESLRAVASGEAA